jgi:hypothetical protein
VGIGVSKWQEDNSQKSFYSDTLFLDYTQDRTDLNITFLLEYLRYFRIHRDIKLFLGIGPRLDFDVNNAETGDISILSGTAPYPKKTIDERYLFGLSFSYGVEWFFKKNMSLHAEYGFYVSYFYDKLERERATVARNGIEYSDFTLDKNKGVILDDSGALLGLSVYF